MTQVVESDNWSGATRTTVSTFAFPTGAPDTNISSITHSDNGYWHQTATPRWLNAPATRKVLAGATVKSFKQFVYDSNLRNQIRERSWDSTKATAAPETTLIAAGEAGTANAISVQRDGKWGYVDRAGNISIPFTFDGPRAQPFTNGLAGVHLADRWGFVNSANEWVVMPLYEDVMRFSEGYAGVRQNGRWGVLDIGGRMRLSPRFEVLGEFDGGMAPAALDGKAGYISPDGQWLVPPLFDQCYRFSGNLAVVRVGDSYAYVSREGSIIWQSEPFAMAQSVGLVLLCYKLFKLKDLANSAISSVWNGCT